MSLTTRQSRMLGTSDGAAATVAPAVLGIKSVRTSQPQQAVGIDWSNPLAPKRGWVIAAINGQPYMFERGKQPKLINVGHKSKVSAIGNGFGCDSTTDSIGYITLPTFSSAVASDGTTLMALAQLSGPATVAHRILDIGSDIPPAWYLFRDSANSGRFTCTFGSSAAGAQFYISPNDEPLAVLFKHDGVSSSSGCSAWIGGKKQTVTNVTAAGGAFQPLSGSTAACIGNRINNGINRGWVGSITLIYADTFARSDAECQSLSQNPWQIFSPLTKQIWVAA